ncbi:MAG TPA: hypothetical protein VGP08_13340 [Pyrinomonadaceae bacterium]|jgi:hypothetical protein|nr:hypothetical protein [Pyrinomonadaceae bacterium]
MKSNLKAGALAFVLAASLAPHAASAQSKRKKSRQKKEQPVAVIGTEGLKAAQAEERRKTSGETGPSPMPPLKRVVKREELGLVRPKPDAYDAALAELSKRYAKSDAATRAAMRRSIDMQDLYALARFGEREAVFGLRERSAERIVDGLTAIAMVEVKRVDFRDVLMSLSLLHHCALRVGASPDKLFRDAAALAEPGTAQLMLDFLKRPSKDKNLRDAWGLEEVETDAGVGFIGWGFQKYDATYDLKRVAIETADLFAADRYESVSPSIASDFLQYWLGSDDKTAFERAMRSARAGASVHASFGKSPHDALDTQLLLVMFEEMSSESAARELLDIANRQKPRSFSMLALAEGRLFCFVIARSTEGGVEQVETGESIRRFHAPLSEIMRRHAGAQGDARAN